MATIRRRLAILCLVVPISACRDVQVGPGTSEMTRSSTLPAAAPPDATLKDTIRVFLSDRAGNPLGGRRVIWRVQRGGGSIDPDTAVTDAAGMAGTRWTLGRIPGLNQISATTIDGQAVRFEIDGRAFAVDDLDANYAGPACGYRSDGVWCWGSWGHGPGQTVSVPARPDRYITPPPPRRWLTDPGYAGVEVSGDSRCALHQNGEVWCGGPPFTERGPDAVPNAIRVPGLPPLSAITSDDWGAYCGLSAVDGTAWCWGGAAVGQLSGAPVFMMISLREQSDGATGCGLQSDSTAVCWDTPGAFNPVPGGHRFTTLASGSDFTCGLTLTLEVWCWGDNSRGQLGVPGPSTDVPVRSQVWVSAISAEGSVVSVVRSGKVQRWGNGFTARDEHTIEDLAGLPVAGFGGGFSCVRLHGGQVYCYHKLWLGSTVAYPQDYYPLHPLVEATP